MENSTTVRKIDSFDRESFTSASDCASSILDVRVVLLRIQIPTVNQSCR